LRTNPVFGLSPCHSPPQGFNTIVPVAAIDRAWQHPPAAGGYEMRPYLVDILAVGFFIIEWTVYAVTLEHTAYGRDSLSARMHGYREVWIRRMLDREARMVDMQIMASLQNGTAFFASTSLLAIGGALALLRSTNEALGVLRELPIDLSPRPRSGKSNAWGWC
jgi:hypothetical protein